MLIAFGAIVGCAVGYMIAFHQLLVARRIVARDRRYFDFDLNRRICAKIAKPQNALTAQDYFTDRI